MEEADGQGVRLFHHTFAAEAILREGFRASRGEIDGLVLEGVWLSDRPLEEQDGARGDAYLEVEIPADLLADFELVEDEKPYREWCVPAELVNRHGPPTLFADSFDTRAARPIEPGRRRTT